MYLCAMLKYKAFLHSHLIYLIILKKLNDLVKNNFFLIWTKWLFKKYFIQEILKYGNERNI